MTSEFQYSDSLADKLLMTSKVLLADDHFVIREGIRMMLGHEPTLEIIAEASDGDAILPLIEEHAPDILLLDLHMPGLSGIGVLGRISKLKAPPKVLVFTASEDIEDIKCALNAGACGYISKNSEHQEIVKAVKEVIQNGRYIPHSLASKLSDSSTGNPFESLSKRELQVACEIAQGTPNREISVKLEISPKTVDNHRANILKKLDLESNSKLTQLALKYRII